ncbi:MAG: cysteine dioxygenase family protein [Pseudonocardia sp.]|nr:cysteine dioxygenase family protein [Pseudonocardia sp.]
MSLHAARAVAPTPLDLTDLTDLTRRIAAEVLAGEHPVHVDPENRWYRRLVGDDYVDVWLISWAWEKAAELHDHAGSLGALTVVSGELLEQRWVAGSPGQPAGLRERTLRAGRGATFPLGHVHEVVNTTDTPAISVHAYSPPLTAMSYYAVEEGPVEQGSRLRRIRTELTAGEPEPVSAGSVPLSSVTTA